MMTDPLRPAFVPLASLAVPAVAAGTVALAVALPVVIHLLFRQRVRVVEWAAMRFLAHAQKRRHRRIDHLVLLGVRLLAVLLPLAGMIAATPWAEPLWQSVVPGRPETVSNAPRTHYVLVVDASLSMSARTGESSRFETAVLLAEQAVRLANPGDGFTLVALGGAAVPVVPGPSNDFDKVAAELRGLKPTHAAADYAAGLAAVADVLGRSPRTYPRRQVLLFTDLQRSAWAGVLPKPDTPPPDVWAKVAGRAEVGVIDVARADLDNLTVADVALTDPVPLVDDPALVTAVVQNFGRTDKQRVGVELLLARPSAGEPALVPVGVRDIETVPAGGRVSVSFTLDGAARFRTAGPHVLQVRLTEPDALPADDQRGLAFEVRDGLACTLVNGRPSGDPLRRASEYLAEALAPEGRASPGNPARPTVVERSAFADPAASDLSAADCVFLCDLPTITPAQVARLEAVLKRGGGVVIGLGPNAAANAETYNRVLFADDTGLLPGRLTGVAEAGPNDPGFRLVSTDARFRRPPLAAFQEDNARGGLTAVPFRKYVKLDAPADGRGQRILSFASAGAGPDDKSRPDPAVVEVARHRGKVIVYTSTFNTEWTDWPVLPSFLPFAHELLRYAAASPGRYTVTAEEPIEDVLPAAAVGLPATLSGPNGTKETATVAAADEGGVVRFGNTALAGLYTLAGPVGRGRVFAVNPADAVAGGGSESDLRRVEAGELKSIHPSVHVAADPTELPLADGEGVAFVTVPRPHGPLLARWAVAVGLLAVFFELWLAWRLGPGRATGPGRADAESAGKGGALSLLPRISGWLLLASAVGLTFSAAHAAATGELLGFLPDGWRAAAEAAAGVPAAGPGEGTRWRLESAAVFGNLRTDRIVTLALAAVAVLAVGLLYRQERRAVRDGRRLILPAALRLAAYAVLLFVVLPQLRLAFDREGWPDVAVILDTSASMGTVDDQLDPEVGKKADELAKATNLPRPHRLQLAQALLTRPDGGWLERLLADRQVKVHLYAVGDQTRLAATAAEAGDRMAATEAVHALVADRPASRLGDGVQAVLKAFRGGSLAAVVVLTDGQTTTGDDLPTAGRAAARAGVPVYLVGFGDPRDPLDLAVGDLRADDVVARNDELVFDARVTARGPGVLKSVRVLLSERIDGKLVPRAEQTITPDAGGKPVPVRLRHVPTEPGEKTYVLEVPVLPGEPEPANNRIERQVVVTDNKRLRVLYVEGYPRYEFRFVKVLLERETDGAKGRKAVELNTLLLDASKDHPTTDRTALRGFPTRAELFEYDVVILGDVSPKQFDRPAEAFQNLADFVTVRGGGLLVSAGEQAVPHQLFGTPLADVLPVAPAPGRGAEPPKPTPDETPLTTGYRPALTPAGLGHPLFRLAGTDAESARLWANLRPLFWAAPGYVQKRTAEVLAVHPARPAEDNPGEQFPLVLQQFAGSGRVLFLGFDDTWRWRWRRDEETFNTFWRQAVKVVARNRVSRPELRTDRQTAYRRDEPIVLTVRFPDDAPPPAEGSVKVTVERGPPRNKDGTPGAGETETRTLVLGKAENARATFQATLTRTPEGEYRFRLTEPDTEGNKPRAEAKVLPPPGELDRLEMNRTDLTRAAAESRGRFFTLADADELIDALPEAARLPLDQPCPPVPVWNHAGTFLLVLLLLCNEWVLRKRERLL